MAFLFFFFVGIFTKVVFLLVSGLFLIILLTVKLVVLLAIDSLSSFSYSSDSILKANKTTSGPFQNPQNNKYNQYYNQNGTNYNSNFNNSSIKQTIIRTSVGSQLSNNCNGANSSNHFE